MGDFFSVGREMTRPRTSGLAFGCLSYEELRSLSMELTPEEAATPSAFHYFEPMATLTCEQRQAVEGPALKPEQCYMPEEAGRRLLNPDGDEVENGYGVLPNGVGFAAMLIRQEGITDEMIKKYREEFAQDGPRTLFYKIWFPGAHLLHYENGVVENFGWGMMNMEMDMEHFTLAHLGIRQEDILQRDPNCISLLGFYGRGWEVDHPEREPVWTSMVQHTRLTPTGRELRVRYWNGLAFGPGGQLVFSDPVDRAVMEERMRLMMEHCLTEYQNELRLMKGFWDRGK